MNGGSTMPRLMSMMSLITDDAVGRAPAPGPISMTFADEVAFDGDAVGDALDLRDGGMLGRHRGMHPLFDPIFRELGDAQQLDPVTQFVGRLDVRRRNRLDAFEVDGVEGRLHAKGEAGKNGQLVGRVEAADVETSGSASAYPASWASRSTSAKERPSCCIRVRM